MCVTCGCGSDKAREADGHPDPHSHAHRTERRVLRVEQEILSRNGALARQNREYLSARGILALNLMSSPGSGKTTLLVETLRRLDRDHPCAVIEGDQQTDLDARRIAATGVPVYQVNTGSGCHLDAGMVRHALEHLDLKEGSLLFIENVGNLVCPALFDLGEAHRVVILSVTEGEDKPLKYPVIFRSAQVLVVNKMDLLSYVSFDLDQCLTSARAVNPDLTVFVLSARTGQGMEAWHAWLGDQLVNGRRG